MVLGRSKLLYIYRMYRAALIQVRHRRGQGACRTVDDGAISVYRFEGSNRWLS